MSTAFSSFLQPRHPDGVASGQARAEARRWPVSARCSTSISGMCFTGFWSPPLSFAQSAPAPAFHSRIEAFLDEYLKSETGPVPDPAAGEQGVRDLQMDGLPMRRRRLVC